jgi:NAD+ kinase
MSEVSKKRKVLLVVHPTRDDARIYGDELSSLLAQEGFDVAQDSADGAEIAVVLGGDGTILRAAQLCRGIDIPILGVNLGSVGFMAEIHKPSTKELVASIAKKAYKSEPRLVVHYSIQRKGEEVSEGWALNEVVIEGMPGAMIQLFVQIDSRPLSRWGCDGVICATPTGSTAYAFSVGGPVVWPEVPALVLLPIAAHALFSRPIVISQDAEIAIDVESDHAHLFADGFRRTDLKVGDRVVITKDSHTVSLAHADDSQFTDRLVAKFKLPVEGWRGEK